MSPARDLAAPPEDISPERLFGLLADPDPSWPIPFRLSGAEDLALEVHPLTAQGWAAAWWAAERAPVEVRRSRYRCEVVSRALWAGGGLAFGSVDEVGALDGLELQRLAAEVWEALSIVGPTYARSDWKAWGEALEKGARHPLMQSTAIALAGCADHGHGATTFRPDRFFGRPTGLLLDGHWMAYRAARKAWIEDDAPKSIADALRQAQARR